MNVHSYDVIIVGGGGSGIASALFLNQAFPNIKIAILCKTYPMGSHTTSAKGGINAALGNINQDSTAWHTYDTLTSGKGLCDSIPTTKMCTEAPSIIDYLSRIGVNFDTTPEGKIDQRVYGGQTTHYGNGELSNRACFVKDHTGHAIMQSLCKHVLNQKNITVFNYTQALDFLYGKPNILLAYNIVNSAIDVLQAKYIIFATGGFSQIYKTNSSSHLYTGCGHRILFQNGICLKDIELVQFHPTGLWGNGMLISEACRSQGAFLRNTKGERFMEKYHHLKELAPRDVVARAIYQELLYGNVYLDLTHIPLDTIRKKLISSYTVAKHFAKIDISKSLLPIHPTAHYNMGGIAVDENYKIKDGIYAIGELACASVHGANRLGCNSLLELFTSAKIATNDIASNFQDNKYNSKHNTKKISEAIKSITNKNSGIKFEEILAYRRQIQEIMDVNASIVKNHKNMKMALNKIDNIYRELENLNNFSGIAFDVDFINLYETQSLALMAKCVLTASIFREHSIGSHYREDFPQESAKPQHTEIDNNFHVKYIDVT